MHNILEENSCGWKFNLWLDKWQLWRSKFYSLMKPTSQHVNGLNFTVFWIILRASCMTVNIMFSNNHKVISPVIRLTMAVNARWLRCLKIMALHFVKPMPQEFFWKEFETHCYWYQYCMSAESLSLPLWMLTDEVYLHVNCRWYHGSFTCENIGMMIWSVTKHPLGIIFGAWNASVNLTCNLIKS